MEFSSREGGCVREDSVDGLLQEWRDPGIKPRDCTRSARRCFHCNRRRVSGTVEFLY